MTDLEDELRATLRAQAQGLRAPERPTLDCDIVESSRHPGPRWLIAAACVGLIAVGVVALALRPGSDTEPAPPVESVVPDRTEPAPPVTTVAPDIVISTPGINGWVAAGAVQDVGGDIYVVRQGEEARRLEVPGSDTGDEACPAWSPDGTRLLFGRLTASSDSAALFDAELVIVPISPDGTAGDPTVIALDGFEPLEGFEGHPCGIWAPDGRWVAFGGGGEVWVVDTQTAEIRRLPDLRPSDLEWRPGTDQLAIAGDMGSNRSAPTLSTPVSVFTVSTGELGQLGSIEAAHVTWSPDGTTLAYEGGEDGPGELRLVDADGANDRALVADRGEVNHGIGPVWSPIGDRIAHQRLIGSGERHEVVLVSVADGIETVIEPPQTDGPNGPAQWYPYSVTWSPDGTTLLYDAWNDGGGGGLITVPVDSPTDATVLNDVIEWGGDAYSHGWVSVQRWGQQPPPSAVALPEEGSLAPGTYTLGKPAGWTADYRHLIITLPTGWATSNGLVYKHLDQDDEVAFSVWNVNDVYDDPCNWQQSSLSELDLGDDQVHKDFHEVATGSTVPKPVNGGLANQLLRNASQMTSVELGGESALRIELSVPGWLDLAACDQGQFRSWNGWGTTGADANAHHTPGQIDVVYMVDVDRKALVIDASYKPATSASDLAELESILASMIVER